MLTGFLISLTAFSFLMLSSLEVSADTVVDDVSILVSESCTLTTSSGSSNAYNVTIPNGQYKNDIGKTRLSIFCNTEDSFAIYAVGYSNDTLGNNEMITTTAGANNIVTGTATGGDTSNWAMKVEAVAGTGASGSYTPTIVCPFNNFAAVPNTWAKVAEVASVTGAINEAAVDASYAVYIAPKQLSANYQGKVRYTVVHPASDSPLMTLSKAYVNAGKTKVNGYYTLQDMTPEICNATEILDEGSQMQAIDTRDNKVYWITKLQDGKCWMTQNLDHDIDSTKTYTPADTDIPANWTPDKSTYPTSTTTWDTSTNGYNIQQSYDPGNKIWDGVTTSSSGTTIDNMTQGTNQHDHLGNYYNWTAAVAMNNTSAYTADSADVNQSICPKGWMLPKSGDITTAGSFQNLVNQYNWASYSMTNPYMWSAPLYFPLAGYWNGSSNNVAFNGSFWSSVVNLSSFAYYMYGLYSGAVSPSTANNRHWGFSVRCVSR